MVDAYNLYLQNMVNTRLLQIELGHTSRILSREEFYKSKIAGDWKQVRKHYGNKRIS